MLILLENRQSSRTAKQSQSISLYANAASSPVGVLDEVDGVGTSVGVLVHLEVVG